MATIKNITHDSGPPLSNHWTSVVNSSGRMSVAVAAALNDSVEGLNVAFGTSGSARVNEPFISPVSEELRLRWYFDPNGASTPTVSNRTLIRVEMNDDGQTAPGDWIGQVITVKRTDGIIRVQYSYGDDTGPNSVGATTDITDTSHCFEIRSKRASSDVASDGEIEFLIDGISQFNKTDVDNFDVFPIIDFIFVEFNPLEAAMSGTILYADEFLLTDDEATSLCVASPVTGLASMHKPADIDAAGEFIYLALLDAGTPILTKISTALDSNGTTVFDPGSGNNIGVECGRFNSDVVWIAGQFDGTNVVEKSEDGGSSFVVKDDATIGSVRSFVVGPDSDERLLVSDESNDDILETTDDGETWTTINSSVSPKINAIARLGENVEECVFGNNSSPTNSINYSVNSGDDLEDFQTGVYPEISATRTIVN